MSWQKTPVKYQKMRFIADWLDGEYSFTDLCRRYQISRQCGYELLNRYKQEGDAAFEERTHARHTHPNQTSRELIQIILDTKHRFLTWGPIAIKAWLEEEYRNHTWPAASTIGDILKKHGLVKKRRLRKRVPPFTEPLKNCNASNEVWSADYKGQFRMANNQYCYPLTITDNFSRYLFCCEGFEKISGEKAIKTFEKVFYENGIPDAIRTDNGYPFAGPALGGLSRLSIWLLKLDILPERIEPGCPQQNPRHERMHRTLKAGIQLNTKSSLREQQQWFDEFRKEFNEQRPHQALQLKRPVQIYQLSRREYPTKLQEVSYPSRFLIRRVKTNGQIKYFGKRYFVSELLHGESIGLEMIDEERAIVYFGKLKLGVIDARLDKISRP
ncbi:MAG TPA: integrase core domain-containing protein [Candidatus Saccharimonadales bacterium]|nr:integrase core domain-containing protein [Candidatus Saccharimonadales bacterium]